jgi:hypothetical protein
MTGMEVTGNARLDEGLVAKIETSFVLSGNPYSLVRHPNCCFLDCKDVELTNPR